MRGAFALDLARGFGFFFVFGFVRFPVFADRFDFGLTRSGSSLPPVERFHSS
ncbi:MAG TPA: hypothetical protein VGP80_14850 [Gemmatimonadales bacterium]|nr:hypothetical protein [Gemmatimonadales bacterium]